MFRKSFLSRALHKIYQYYEYISLNRLTKKQAKDVSKRANGYDDPRYAKLKELKGKYAGKRCFITCTGPSLTIKDLEKLNGEYVFGMNSICLIHDKTDWKPDFFGIQDVKVYEKVKDKMLATDNGQVFAPYAYYEQMNTPENWIYFPMSWAYHIYDKKYKEKYFAKFSGDCYETVYDGFTITYSIMQLAFYLGFDELYLIGADCTYLGQQQHFIETGHMVSQKDSAKVQDKMFAVYHEAKAYAEAHGLKIYNATRGGFLEIFQRVSLEEVLSDNQKNKNSL
jgi:hypothetical protein